MSLTPSPERARELLVQWGAPPHLLRHAELVGGVAKTLAEALNVQGAMLQVDWIEAAAILHDAGKIMHPEELHSEGHAHELAGQALLREHGVAEDMARVCVSHARWEPYSCSLHERVVALADNLWKGKRLEALEDLVSQQLADELDQTFWEVSVALNETFEEIASQGSARLEASRL